MLFSRISPIAKVTVKGVKIRALIPLGEVGIYDTVKRWEVREPEMLQWMDGMKPDDVFFDVGGGFGTESLYAALKTSGPKNILSFDVDLMSTFVHVNNVALNGIKNVDVYFVALAETSGFHKFPLNSNYYAIEGMPKGFGIPNYVAMIRLDEFVKVQNIFPTYLKIDVDGFESSVIQGARETISNPRLKSVAIEVGESTTREVTETLESCGFSLSGRGAVGYDKTLNLIFERKNR